LTLEERKVLAVHIGQAAPWQSPIEKLLLFSAAIKFEFFA